MDRMRYLIGLATLLITVVLGFYLFSMLSDDDGAEQYRLQVEFRDLRGLKPGADLRYRGVRVGSVRDVGLAPDGQMGRVTLLIEPDVADLARQASRFWIVVPRFSGIAGGASGLDTLVRDAYVAFLTPEPAGPRLPPGSLIAGLEKPLDGGISNDLDPLQRGDLLMTLLAAENQGIEPGMSVRFRGLDVGDVRSVELGDGGGHIEILLRIRHKYRRTVTEQSGFWIARPRLSGALLRGIDVADLDSLLTPFVGYHSSDPDAVPVADGHRVVVSDDRPDIAADDVPAWVLQARSGQGIAPSLESGDDIRLVEVLYEVVEEDWLSRDDRESRRGSGLLFLAADGRPVVLTTRSLCDGSFFLSDTFGSAEIGGETIRIGLPGGSVLRAGRSWVAPGGEDLALLVVEGAPVDLPVTPAERMSFDAVPSDAVPRDRVAEPTGIRRFGEAEPREPGQWQAGDDVGAVSLVDDRVTGVISSGPRGRAGFTVLPLTLLPEELRPKP